MGVAPGQEAADEAPYRLSIEPAGADGGPPRWIARVEGLPGFVGEGETPAAAVAAAEARTGGEALPQSGRLLLRMPRALHAELAARADDAGVSLNQLIVGALASAVAGRPAAAARSLPTALRVALAANALVVVLAAVTALLLLSGAWRP